MVVAPEHGEFAGSLSAVKRLYARLRGEKPVETKDVVMIVVFSVVASTLAGLIPAWRAAKLKPVEALRSE